MTIIGWVLSFGGLAILSCALIAYIKTDPPKDLDHIDWEQWE